MKFINILLEDSILGEQNLPKSLGTQNQVNKFTQIRKYQKFIQNEKDEIEIKPYPKTNKGS